MPIKKIADLPKSTSTRKIADIPARCTDPEHNPPTHQHLENGIYEHVCPSCNKTTRFTVIHPSMGFSYEYDDESSDYIRSSIED